MPFETPWAKRKRLAIESQPGCEGAVEFARRVKLHLDEFLRITGDVSKRGTFRQRDYSYVLGLLQEQEKFVPPPAGADLHAGMLALLRSTREGIRRLDPAGNQRIDEIRGVFDEAERVLEQLVIEPWERFNAACFPEAAQQSGTAGSMPPGAAGTESFIGTRDRSSTLIDVDPASVDRARLAQFLRQGERGVTPFDSRDLEPLSLHLQGLAVSPDRWDGLSAEWLSLLLFHQMLSYAYAGTDDPVRLSTLRVLYIRAIPVMGMRSRMALEDDVARQLDSDPRHVLVLEPFMLAGS